jgi:signal transduction histidine kinase
MNCVYACLCLLFGLSLVGKSQSLPHTADSLRQRLTASAADTNRVLLLDHLAEALATANAPQSLRYGEEGLRLARHLGYATGEVLLQNELAITYFKQEDLHNAARYFQQAIRRAGQVPQAGRQLTLALLGLGRIAVMQHDYVESQQYFRLALRRMEQHRHPVLPKDIGIVRNNLGILYFDWLSSGQAYPDSIKRLCLYYNRLALATQRQGKPGAALAVCLNGMGHAHRAAKHYDSTEYYHRAALRLFQQLASPYDIAQTQDWLGDALVAQHRAPEAVPLLRTALASAKRLHLPALRADCSLQLAAALAATGQGGAAYQLAKFGHTLLDSLNRANQRANLTRLRVQFDTEQQRNQVQELTHRSRVQQLQARRQQQYLWWLGSFALAVAMGLLVAGLLARRLRRQHTVLQTARAEQDRLYALIAHDLRSPVVAFTGLADLLTTYVERQDTSRLLRLGGRVRQAATSLHELLDNLLHWALAQRGELTPRLEPLPVAELLADLLRLYQPSAEAANVLLLLEAAPPAVVLGDRNMTMTILRNLISNALQATPAGGRIVVRTVITSPREVLLEVTDTGQGMSPEELRQALGMIPPHAQRARGRAGLGLRLSQLFAQAQAGALALRSVPGQGTSATLTLGRVLV